MQQQKIKEQELLIQKEFREKELALQQKKQDDEMAMQKERQQNDFKLQQIFQKNLCTSNVIDHTSPSALWCLMMTQQCCWDSNGDERLFFTDNFYTRHVLAKELRRITDNKASLIGTIRANNVEKGSKKYVEEAMKMLEDAPQGSWKLVQVLENVLRVANTLPACCGGCQSNERS